MNLHEQIQAALYALWDNRPCDHLLHPGVRHSNKMEYRIKGIPNITIYKNDWDTLYYIDVSKCSYKQAQQLGWYLDWGAYREPFKVDYSSTGDQIFWLEGGFDTWSNKLISHFWREIP